MSADSINPAEVLRRSVSGHRRLPQLGRLDAEPYLDRARTEEPSVTAPESPQPIADGQSHVPPVTTRVVIAEDEPHPSRSQGDAGGGGVHRRW